MNSKSSTSLSQTLPEKKLRIRKLRFQFIRQPHFLMNWLIKNFISIPLAKLLVGSKKSLVLKAPCILTRWRDSWWKQQASPVLVQEYGRSYNWQPDLQKDQI